MKHRRAKIGRYGFIGAEKLIKFALPPYKIYKKTSRVIPVKKMNPQGASTEKSTSSIGRECQFSLPRLPLELVTVNAIKFRLWRT